MQELKKFDLGKFNFISHETHTRNVKVQDARLCFVFKIYCSVQHKKRENFILDTFLGRDSLIAISNVVNVLC